MTHFSDLVRVGRAGMPGDNSRQTPNGVTFTGGGVYGVPLASDATPLDLVPIQTFSNNLAAAAVISGGNWTIAAGTGITTTTINGVTYYDQGTDRSLLFLGVSAPVTATLVTVTGKDSYLQNVTATFTGPSGTGTVQTVKTMRYVAGVFSAGNTTSGVAIGTGDTFGLPFVASSWNYINQVVWNNTFVTTSAGFTVADVTSPATSGTGDVRGTYQVQTVSTNGTLRLSIYQFIKDPNTVSGIYGVVPA